jgi:hypothetical protein
MPREGGRRVVNDRPTSRNPAPLRELGRRG